MNLTKLRRGIEHLAVLLEIRAGKEESEKEKRLKLRLLAVLALVLANEDYRAFEASFLNALRESYEKLDVNDEFGDLIDRELIVQGNYLNGFINDLRGDEISEAQARMRVGQYATSLGKMGELFELQGMGLDTMGRWDKNPELENCDDCNELDGQVHAVKWYITTGHTPKSEMQRCGHNCGCGITPV